MSHYKTKEEMAYLSYASSEVEKTQNYFYKILTASKIGRDLSKLSMKLLEDRLAEINKTIKRLREYEMSVAYYERKRFRQNYRSTMINMTLIRWCCYFAMT